VGICVAGRMLSLLNRVVPFLCGCGSRPSSSEERGRTKGLQHEGFFAQYAESLANSRTTSPLYESEAAKCVRP